MRSLEIGGVLGVGSMGTVYQALWHGTPVAVKACHTAIGSHELSLLSALRHPNINRLLGACVYGGTTHLVLEYMERGDLMHLLHSASFQLDPALLLRMALDAAHGVAYLHLRQPVVIHRDLKCQNLLVSESYRVVLSDFGFARTRTRSMARTRCGSPAWLAPEILEVSGWRPSAGRCLSASARASAVLTVACLCRACRTITAWTCTPSAWCCGRCSAGRCHTRTWRAARWWSSCSVCAWACGRTSLRCPAAGSASGRTRCCMAGTVRWQSGAGRCHRRRGHPCRRWWRSCTRCTQHL